MPLTLDLQKKVLVTKTLAPKPLPRMVAISLFKKNSLRRSLYLQGFPNFLHTH